VVAIVRHADEIKPDPAWQDKYRRMQPIFDTLYFNSQSLYAALDALAETPLRGK
jgi:xylulokinase